MLAGSYPKGATQSRAGPEEGHHTSGRRDLLKKHPDRVVRPCLLDAEGQLTAPAT